MIPNLLSVVQDTKRDYPVEWANAHSGNSLTEEFIHLLAARCHQINSRFGLNGKRGNPNDLSDDAINFLCDASESTGRTPEGLPCVVIDVIGAAGSPTAFPTWQVFNRAPDANGAWVRPDSVPPKPEPPPHVCPPCPPIPETPSYEALGGDAFFRAQVGVPLAMDMASVGQSLNDGSSVWFSRTTYSLIAAFLKHGNHDEAPAILRKHRNEWRTILGLPPI